MTYPNPTCNERLPCFAKRNGKCRILTSTYHIGERCPFCKEYQDDKPVRKKKHGDVPVEENRDSQFDPVFLETASGQNAAE